MLLPILVLVFLVIVGFIVYANWPAAAAAGVTQAQTCQSCGEPPKRCGCRQRQPPCAQCGMPKPQCGCPKKQECSFC